MQYLKTNEISYIQGITWTTDAIFRETADRIAKRKDEGAKIVEMPFREQFEGKHIRNNAGEVVSVAVLKNGKKAEGQEQVDAISGATITCDGVHKMIATNLSEYAAFLNEDVEPINTEEE